MKWIVFYGSTNQHTEGVSRESVEFVVANKSSCTEAVDPIPGIGVWDQVVVIESANI
jgi:hypothetical protein